MEKAEILSEKRLRNDRVLYTTRCLSIIIVPILLVSVGALYLFPDHTRELFAWTIKPRMSPILLGAVYLMVYRYPHVLIKPFAMSAKLTDIAWNYSSSYFAGH